MGLCKPCLHRTVLGFGRCPPSRNSQARTHRGFSTRFESAPRNRGGAWRVAKGCESSPAEAEGLQLLSPEEVQHYTTIGRPHRVMRFILVAINTAA